MFWITISIMFLLMQLNLLTIFNVINRLNLFENNINREIFNPPRKQLDYSRDQRERSNEYSANRFTKPQKLRYISNETKYNYNNYDDESSEE